MKKIILLLSILYIGCKPKPEFTINGKEYYTLTKCLKSHVESKYGYHYGYNFMSGKFERHLGHYTETICDQTKTDTIEIK